jgi:FG-GAP-like repeat
MTPAARLPAVPLAAIALALAVLAPAAAQGAVRVVDVSKQAGVADVTKTWSAEAGDVNGDGWPDLLVGNHYEKPAYLYENDKDGTFTRVGSDVFPAARRDRHDCSFGDANDDGRTDIFCSIGGERGAGHKPKELWVQSPQGTFQNEADAYGVTDTEGRGRDNTFLDVDHDGLDDLYVANKFPRTDGLISRNRLFINELGTHYRSAPEYGLDHQVGGKIVQRVDFDGDGWDDLLVCGERRLFLFRNVKGKRFDDVARRSGVADSCESTVLAKFNHDARPDLAVLTRTRLKVFTQKAGGGFGHPAYKRKVAGGTELAAGKVSRDTLADLYVVQRGEGSEPDRPDLLLLDRRGGHRFSRVKIPQTRRGKGDYVVSLDYDRNGRSDFLVLNGFHKHEGPVRLLATNPFEPG